MKKYKKPSFFILIKNDQSECNGVKVYWREGYAVKTEAALIVK